MPQNSLTDDCNLSLPCKKANRLRLLLLSMALFVGGWSYWPAISEIVASWTIDPDYSHGFLVVPISIAFLIVRRDLCPPMNRSGADISGIALLVVAAVLRFAAGRLYLPALNAWSIPIWLGGTVLLLFGRSCFRWALPSIAFLWFAVPLPGSLEVLLSTPLQQFAAAVGSWSLRIFGQPAIAEGTTILLSDHILDIERACSGLRMFYGILAMATAYAILLRVKRWSTCVLLLATIPIALIANVIRITLTGILLREFSDEAAQKFSHDFAGLLMIPIAVVLFAILATWLRKLERQRQEAPEIAVWTVAKCAIYSILALGALLAWGNHQAQLAVTTLLAKAGQYEGEQDWRQATSYLQRYLQMRPSDEIALERYADCYAKAATSKREKRTSVSLAMKAWKQNPSREDLALQAARMSYEIGAISKALAICEDLAETELSDEIRSELTLIHADSLLVYIASHPGGGNYSWDRIAQILTAANDRRGGDVGYVVEVARIWEEKLLKPNKEARQESARQVVDSLVDLREKDPMAWLARYRYLKTYRSSDKSALQQAANDLEKSLELIDRADARGKCAILMAAAKRARALGDLEQAEGYLESAIEARPEFSSPYITLAEIKRRGTEPQRLQLAAEVLEKGLKAIEQPVATLLLPLAALQTDMEQWELAGQSIHKINEQLEQYSGTKQSKLKLGAAVVEAELILVSEGEYPAIRYLESTITNEAIRVQRQTSPKLFAQAHLLLGRLYKSVGILDRASEHYRQALHLDIADSSVRAEAIAVVLDSGDLKSADLLCRQLLRDDPTSKEALVALVIVRTREQSRQPIELRNWEDAERALQVANQRIGKTVSLTLAEVEYLETRGSAGESRESLNEALEIAPNVAALWRESALLWDRQGKAEAALESADRYIELRTNEVEPVVLRAKLLAKARRGEDAENLLRSQIKHSSEPNRTKLAYSLARLQLLIGKVSAAKSTLKEILRTEGDNLVALNTLADIAWANENWSEHEENESRLHDVEGSQGTLWRFHRALRLLEQAVSLEDQRFREVAKLGQTIRNLRPRWSKTSLLEGYVAERTGKLEAAIAAFQRAWELGDRSALLADRLIELLTSTGREREAESYVLQVQGALTLSSQLFERALPYLLASDPQTALRVAQTWAERRPGDAAAHLRLGKVLLALADNEDVIALDSLKSAKASLLRALELRPQRVDIWLENIRCEQARKGVRLETEKILEELATTIGLDDGNRTLLFAKIYQEMGLRLNSHKSYRVAFTRASDSGDSVAAAEALSQLSAKYQDVSPSLAERYARLAIFNDKNSVLAHRVLLSILADSTRPEDIREGLELITSYPADLASADEEFLRAKKAKLLSQRGDAEGRELAIEVLETLLNPTPSDESLLASLYEQAGRLGPAYEVHIRLANQRKALTRDRVNFLMFWQRNFLHVGDQREGVQFASVAAGIYDQLLASPKTQADWLRVKISELRVTFTETSRSWPQIELLISQLMSRNKNLSGWTEPMKLAWCRAIFQVLLEESLAESTIAFTGQQRDNLKQSDVLVALCHAAILTRELSIGDSELDEYLSRTSKDEVSDGSVHRAIGDALFMRGRYEQAADAYRSALDHDASDMLASNNLALSLSEVPDRLNDAMDVLIEAIDRHGRDAVLVDTKSVLELMADRPKAALASIGSVIEESPNNAAAILHAAMASRAIGDDVAAKNLFLDAMMAGLSQPLLSLRDRDFCREMLREDNWELLQTGLTTLQSISRVTTSFPVASQY